MRRDFFGALTESVVIEAAHRNLRIDSRSRVSVSLKVFLTALAIIDDLGAVALIGLLYTDDLALGWLVGAGAILVGLWAFNRAGVGRLAV